MTLVRIERSTNAGDTRLQAITYFFTIYRVSTCTHSNSAHKIGVQFEREHTAERCDVQSVEYVLLFTPSRLLFECF